MNNYKVKRFSLIELLVAISIIAVLVTVTVGGASALVGRAKRLASQAKAVGIKMAIENFANDNRNMLPISESSSPRKDTIISNGVFDGFSTASLATFTKISDVSAYENFIKKLMGEISGTGLSGTSAPLVTVLNKREKAYLKFEGATNSASMNFLEQFQDSFGKYMVIILDTNYDGKIEYEKGGKKYTIRAKTLVFSGGSDGYNAAPSPECGGFSSNVPKSW